MDRAEIIALLTELREAGEEGSPRWSRLMEGIRQQGHPLHDPEFVTCIRCGNEFEPVTGTERQNGFRALQRCFNCHPAEQVERIRRGFRERRAAMKETP